MVKTTTASTTDYNSSSTLLTILRDSEDVEDWTLSENVKKLLLFGLFGILSLTVVFLYVCCLDLIDNDLWPSQPVREQPHRLEEVENPNRNMRAQRRSHGGA